MGYRSDVGLCIKRESHNRAGDRLLISPLDDTFKDGMLEIYESQDQILFVWESVGWYNTPVDDLIAMVDIDDFLFVRIGEDDSDIEVRGGLHHNDFDFGYTRSLVYTYDA